VGADAVGMVEGSTDTPHWPGVNVPPGSKGRACPHGGSPGTWEALVTPPLSGQGYRTNKSQVHGNQIPPAVEANCGQGWYRDASASEAHRDGGKGVGASA
jgi:hypothetical protein